jgi:hypothetical protein
MDAKFRREVANGCRPITVGPEELHRLIDDLLFIEVTASAHTATLSIVERAFKNPG